MAWGLAISWQFQVGADTQRGALFGRLRSERNPREMRLGSVLRGTSHARSGSNNRSWNNRNRKKQLQFFGTGSTGSQMFFLINAHCTIES